MADFFHLIGDEHIASIVQFPGNFLYNVFFIGRKYDH